MKPVIAIAGRPNVGKSTLFNRLTASRDALMINFPGLTRDRQYGAGELDGREFLAVDMGGISSHAEGIDREVVAQALLAIEEADLVLFVLDARDGLTPEDRRIHQRLRERGKRCLVVANKTDGLDPDQARAEFHELGAAAVFAIAASQGTGVKALLREAFAAIDIAQSPNAPAQDTHPPVSTRDTHSTPSQDTHLSSAQDIHPTGAEATRISFIGRPNVGKSTLVNRMLGEDRVLVFDEPGTTRDSIEIPFRRQGRAYTLIDTAGIRRRGKTRGVVEKFSVIKSLQAIAESDVVVFLIDASEGVVDQDLHLLGHIVETGKALVLACNKWDGLEEHRRQWFKREIDRRLGFVDFAQRHFISALHGSGVGKLREAVDAASQSSRKVVSTAALTRMLEQIVAASPPPLSQGRRIKLRYAHLGGHNPLRIVIHGKQLDKLPGHYRRYLQNSFRGALELVGLTVRIELRNDDNPYARDEQRLDPRQIARRRRLQKRQNRN